ncbi:uncharacterized protein Triagg1_10924 [Trichoderma aggressivum f. europaeum]|uniref:Uncharacterized protein n=1 Tax=Trichoderma aggressivum f. europaeum TaxID=173218 RepID=A0AAE1I593_9HYPO|nr:hypothetical protein Triagg1_10924 [Trichoderma aggressivum f. europaeum]
MVRPSKQKKRVLPEGVPAFAGPKTVKAEAGEEAPEEQRIGPKFNPKMASGFEPAEDFEDRWKGCTVIFGNDELNTAILSPDQQILVETEDQPIYLRDGHAVIPEDEVMKYRVLARCQHLTCGPAKEPRAKADGENANDSEALMNSISDGKSVYIGQSMHMDGSVIASGQNEEKHSSGFDFKGLDLKSEPQKVITGSGTIPHWWKDGYFCPHSRIGPAIKQEIPPEAALTKQVPPRQPKLSIQEYIVPHTLDIFMDQLRCNLSNLVKDGFLSVNGSTKLELNRDLEWVPRGSKRVAEEELETPPAKVIRGPDASRTPSPVPSGDFVGDPGPDPIPDYAEYEDLMKVWSAAPAGVHWAWKAKLEDAKGLEEGNRSEAALRDLLAKASEAEDADWRVVFQQVKDAFEKGQAVSDQVIDTQLALAFGRIMGICPPEGPVTNVWGNYFRRAAGKVNRGAAFCIGEILSNLQRPDTTNKEFVEEDLKELRDNVQARAAREWLGKWVELIAPDLYSKDD